MRFVPFEELLATSAGVCAVAGDVALWRWDDGFAGLSQWGPNQPGDVPRFFVFLDRLLDDAQARRFDFLADNLRMRIGDQDRRTFDEVHAGLVARGARIIARHRRMASVLADNAMALAIAAGQESVVCGAYERRVFSAFGPALAWLERPEASRLVAWLTDLPEAARAHGSVVVQVRAHLAEGASCSGAQLARRLGVSLRSLQRALAAEGTTLPRERVAARMRCAQRMLAQDDAKVEAIARAVGYRSVSHFIRTYQQLTGETPGQVLTRSRAAR